MEKIYYIKHNKDLPDLNFKEGYGHSVAIDLYNSEDIELGDFQSALIPLGVSIKIPEGYKIDLRMRSSTFKKWGLIQTNAVGLIDTNYCGFEDELKLPVYKLPINYTGGVFTNRVKIPKGTSLCQMEIVRCMDNVELIPLETKKYLDLVEGHNRGGFGSTDKVGG